MEAAARAIHAAICEESLEDHLDPAWPGKCVRAAKAAAPHLAEDRASRDQAIRQAKQEAFEQGQKSGIRHADRRWAASEMMRPDLPGPISPNPYAPKGDDK